MKDEITDKLTDFLNRIERFSEENQVLWVLVELRKLLDHYRSDARLVRFYADWSVHIDKKHITDEIKAVSAAIYQNAADKINADHPLAIDDIEITNFAHGHALAAELERFMRHVQLPTHLVTSDEMWNSFISLMVKVLENQPIIKPCAGIAKMYFASAAKDCVILRIDFTNPIKGYTHYRYMSNLPK